VTLATAIQPETPSLSLGLKSNEAIRTFSVAVQSNEDTPMTVFGVQTTSGLYVVDYPKVIGPKTQATVTLLYIAKSNSTESVDLLRLMTNHGEKVVQITHDREQAIKFDTTSLQWQQGEAPNAKVVNLTVAPNSSVPKGIKIMGSGNTATLEDLGGGHYQISVVPVSTAKVSEFPAFIQFVPALPGATTTISCSIIAK
jgi:hypothetical protein